MKSQQRSPLSVLQSGTDYLAIPASAEILDLAAARYEDVAWTVTPEDAAASHQVQRASGGARFRGATSPVEPLESQLSLDRGVVLTGPALIRARDAQSLGLLGVDHQLFTLPHVSEPQATALAQWAVAAARHSWGAVIRASGDIVRPDPEALVGLRLYSPDIQPTAAVLDIVRPVLPRAQVFTRDDGSEAVFTTLEYDGAIVINCYRAGRDLPAVMASINWRDYGPHIYDVTWIPPDGEAIDTPDPSSLFLIARGRAALLIAKTVSLLRQRLDGTILDADAFLVRNDDLDHRAKGRRRGL